MGIHASSSALYEVKGIEYGYSIGGRQYTPVLKGLDLTIPKNCFSCLVGPSGMGKTTLLNLLGLLDRPKSGEILLDGVTVASLKESQLEQVRLRDIGFVFQSYHLIPTLNALENTSYFLPSLGYPKWQARERAMEILESVGLGKFATQKPLELSGGQRQRLAIARALAKKPKVILADEPTANLDRKTAEEIITLFKDLHASGQVSFIFSTHDMHLVSYADQVYTLNDGAVTVGGAHS